MTRLREVRDWDWYLILKCHLLFLFLFLAMKLCKPPYTTSLKVAVVINLSLSKSVLSQRSNISFFQLSCKEGQLTADHTVLPILVDSFNFLTTMQQFRSIKVQHPGNTHHHPFIESAKIFEVAPKSSCCVILTTADQRKELCNAQLGGLAF